MKIIAIEFLRVEEESRQELFDRYCKHVDNPRMFRPPLSDALWIVNEEFLMGEPRDNYYIFNEKFADDERFKTTRSEKFPVRTTFRVHAILDW